MNAKELGLGDARLPAESQQHNWGPFILGKRVKVENSPLWARVSMPEVEGLDGKNLRTQIRLDVTYPAESGGHGFQDIRQTYTHTADLHLAQPYAGLTYLVLWWGGLVIGGALILFAGLLLHWLAGRRKRRALPSKLIAIGDRSVPAARPAV
jgi:hypothetical protein